MSRGPSFFKKLTTSTPDLTCLCPKDTAAVPTEICKRQQSTMALKCEDVCKSCPSKLLQRQSSNQVIYCVVILVLLIWLTFAYTFSIVPFGGMPFGCCRQCPANRRRARRRCSNCCSSWEERRQRKLNIMCKSKTN